MCYICFIFLSFQLLFFVFTVTHTLLYSAEIDKISCTCMIMTSIRTTHTPSAKCHSLIHTQSIALLQAPQQIVILVWIFLNKITFRLLNFLSINHEFCRTCSATKKCSIPQRDLLKQIYKQSPKSISFDSVSIESEIHERIFHYGRINVFS